MRPWSKFAFVQITTMSGRRQLAVIFWLAFLERARGAREGEGLLPSSFLPSRARPRNFSLWPKNTGVCYASNPITDLHSVFYLDEPSLETVMMNSS